MATIQNFEELKIWRKAKTLCEHVFDLDFDRQIFKGFWS
jgi:hypothetical protein